MLRWDHLVALEDLLSTLQNRNAADLSPEPESFCSALARLGYRLDDDAAPPRTLVVTLSERLGGHLSAIVEMPRSLLRRDHRLQRPHRLRLMDSRCRRWYARQPGYTAIEKSGPRGRLLGVVREDKVDIVENRVTAAVVVSVEQRAKHYLSLFERKHPDHEHVSLVRRFRREAKGFSNHPDLAGVAPIAGPVRPTNALLQNVHYRAVWDAFSLLRREEERLTICWSKQFELLNELTALAALFLLGRMTGGGICEAALLVPEPHQAMACRFLTDGGAPTAVSLYDGEILELAVGIPHAHCSANGGSLADRVSKRAKERQTVVIGGRYGGNDYFDELPSCHQDLTSPVERLHFVQETIRELLHGMPLSQPAWAQGLAPSSAEDASVACACSPWVMLPDSAGRPVALSNRTVEHDNDSQAVLLAGGGLPALTCCEAAHWTGESLWSLLREGQPEAACGILGSAFPIEDGFVPHRVLVVPERLDMRELALLGERMPGASHRWLLPRSVGAALAAETRNLVSPPKAGDAVQMMVLMLGGPRAELAVLDWRNDNGVGPEWWHPRPKPLARWSAESIIDDLISVTGIAEELRDRTRRALLAVRDLPTRLASGDPLPIPIPAGDNWELVTFSPQQIEEACSLAAESLLRIVSDPSLPISMKDGTKVLVEGWPLTISAFRQKVLSGKGWLVLEEPNSVAQGALVFRDRISEGKPTYVEVLPKVELETTSEANRSRRWTTVVEGQALRPGKTLRRRLSRFGKVEEGHFFDVMLPFRIDEEEQPFLARWRRREVKIRQELPFHITVSWKAGAGGLSLELEPAERGAPISACTVTWSDERDVGEEMEFENAFPGLPRRGYYNADDVEKARSAFAKVEVALKKLKGKKGLDRSLSKELRAVSSNLPYTCWREVSPGGQASWDALRRDIGPTMLWAIGCRLDKKGKKSIGHLDNHARKRVQEERGPWLRAASGLGPDAPASLLDRVAFVVREMPRHHKKNKRKTRETDLDAWLQAAGRICGPGDGMHQNLCEALVDVSCSLALDEELRRHYAWAVATAFFSHDDLAGNLADGEVDTLTDALLAMGDGLVMDRDVSDAWNELGLALLGLLRTRDGREKDRGPTSAWSRRISEHIAQWTAALPPEVRARKSRIREGSSRNIWETLDETLRGIRRVLVLTVEE